EISRLRIQIALEPPRAQRAKPSVTGFPLGENDVSRFLNRLPERRCIAGPTGLEIVEGVENVGHDQIDPNRRRTSVLEIPQGLGELGAQETERLAELIERYVVESDNEHACRRGPRSSKVEAAVEHPVLESAHDVRLGKKPGRDGSQRTAKRAAPVHG